MGFAEDIKKSGPLQSGVRVKHTDAATTVRVRNGKVSTTDGPVRRDQSSLDGYFLIGPRI